MNSDSPKEAKLITGKNGLTLTDGEIELTADFTRLIPRMKKSNLEKELIVRAVKIKGIGRPLKIVDATAGLGEDSFLLAAAGNEVLMYEFDETVFALLEDALLRAVENPELSGPASRIKTINGDSVKAMKDLPFVPDVIYLDPMFPERTKSALVRKKFQLIHSLEKPCENETELLEAAISAKPRKIVIKRPLKGEYLDGRKPDYSLKGKAIRFDVLLFPDNL